jgi:hypothetical protein
MHFLPRMTWIYTVYILPMGCELNAHRPDQVPLKAWQLFSVASVDAEVAQVFLSRLGEVEEGLIAARY